MRGGGGGLGTIGNNIQGPEGSGKGAGARGKVQEVAGLRHLRVGFVGFS